MPEKKNYDVIILGTGRCRIAGGDSCSPQKSFRTGIGLEKETEFLSNA